MVSYSLNDDIGTRQRLSGPSHRFQCALDVLRMFVVPLSGSSRSSSLKSTAWPLARSLSARLRCRVHQRLARRRHAPARHHELALRSGLPNDRRRIVGKDARHRRQVAGEIARHVKQPADRVLVLGDAVEVAHGVYRSPGHQTEGGLVALIGSDLNATRLPRLTRYPAASEHDRQCSRRSSSWTGVISRGRRIVVRSSVECWSQAPHRISRKRKPALSASPMLGDGCAGPGIRASASSRLRRQGGQPSRAPRAPALRPRAQPCCKAARAI